MRSSRPARQTPVPRAPLALRLAVGLVLAFLHLPFAVILLYCFTTEDASFRFPPPGLTLRWFEVAWNRPDVWAALLLSLKVATAATALALLLGTLAAAAVERARFVGREALSLLLLLPIALPGIVTGRCLGLVSWLKIQIGSVSCWPVVKVVTMISSKDRAKESIPPAKRAVARCGSST